MCGCAEAEQEKALQADVAYLDLEALALRTSGVAGRTQAAPRQRQLVAEHPHLHSATGGRMGRAAGAPLF
jgi:hypothetical protein